MNIIKALFDPGRPWVLLCALLAALCAMASPTTFAADVPTPYQSLLNKAGEIQNAQAAVLKEYAAAATEREKEKPAALLACSQMKDAVVIALCVLGVNGSLVGSASMASQAALPAVNLPAPAPEPEGWGSKLWNGTLALFDRALGVYGIREQRRTSVDLAQINAGVSIAQINGQTAMVTGQAAGTVQLGVASVNALAAAATRPVSPSSVTTITGNTGPVQVGDGQQTYAPITGSYNPQYPLTRCTTTAAGVQTCSGP